ncbi:hypothetical protein JCM8547_008210 [Rhodosporidiobolus lusitaniae]
MLLPGSRRSFLTTLLSTRRGVVFLALFVGSLYFLLRPSPSPLSSSASGSIAQKTAPELSPAAQGYADRLKQSWREWRAGGLNDPLVAGAVGGGAGATSEGVGKGVKQTLAEAKEEWSLAEPDEGRDVDIELEEEGGDEMFVQPVRQVGKQDYQEEEEVVLVDEEEAEEWARQDPVEAMERRPTKDGEENDEEEPFGVSSDDADDLDGDTNGDGLLSEDELAALDESSSSSSSLERISSDSPSSSSSPDSYDDLDDSPLPEEADWASGSFPSSAEDETEGSADDSYDVEEQAEADAPSIAAKEDAAGRAPMAALAAVGKSGGMEAKEHAAAGDGKGKMKQPVAPPPPPPPPAAAKPLLNGGKKVGTGGKLAAADAGAGGARPAAGAAVKEKAQGAVKEEAGKRVGTGARPGAKGMAGRANRMVRRVRRP